MGDIFQEVDEEVRRDRLNKLWKDYGGYIIAVAVAILLGTTASVGWREYVVQRKEADSDRFVAAIALADNGRPAEAVAAFQAISKEAGGGYALFAKFRAAAAFKDSGDVEGAIQTFEAIALDDGVDALYRDLATLLAVMHRIDGGDPEALRVRLTPLLVPGGIWRHSAREMSGALALRIGDRRLAKTEFQKLADDLLAPPGARAFATEILQILGD